MQVKAVSKYVGISPRKLALIADIARGKSVDEALTILRFTPTPGARAVAKVIKSAASNAENNFQMSPYDLKVINILIDQGSTLKRSRAQARGRGNPIRRHSSHITVIVDAGT